MTFFLASRPLFLTYPASTFNLESHTHAHTLSSPLKTVKVSKVSWSPFTFAAYLITVEEQALIQLENGTCQSAMLYSFFLQRLKASNVFTRHVLRETSQTDMHIRLLPIPRSQ